jgi:sterol desaturase/sphingolipid hydroxylase (fatty acid hydroxylase superfamily)
VPESGAATFQLVRSVGLAAALAIALVWEWRRPHARLRPAWRTNLGIWAADTVLVSLAFGASGWTAATWASSHGLGLLRWAGVGPLLSIAIGVLALDAVSYAWHRANHRLPFLWRFHQVHHGDASFHVTTALRFHPGELLLALPVRLGAIVLLGVPPQGVLAFELVFGVANLLEHGNFDLPARLESRVQRLLVTPTLHRWHHVAQARDLDTNFGTIFSFWDRLAYTFRANTPDRQFATGLPDRSGPAASALLGWLALPFERRAPPSGS